MTTGRMIRSVAGVALLGAGAYFLRENLDQAASRFQDFLGLKEGPGLVTALTVAATRGWQAYTFDRPEFVHHAVLFTLASFRPLVLIVRGAFLTRNIFTDDCGQVLETDCGNGRARL